MPNHQGTIKSYRCASTLQTHLKSEKQQLGVAALPTRPNRRRCQRSEEEARVRRNPAPVTGRHAGLVP